MKYSEAAIESRETVNLSELIEKNVSNRPRNDANAAEDFIVVVTITYVVAAVMSYFSMAELCDLQ